MKTSNPDRRRRQAARGFTLVELIVAGLITTMVVTSLTLAISQIGTARNNTKRRLDAALRADAALTVLRRDIASIVRTDDLFFTRLLIVDGGSDDIREDEIALFITQLRPNRNPDNYTGEGIEYESHFRIEWDDQGPALYQRRDVMADEFPLGGGMVTPVVGGIYELSLEAYDGYDWYEDWDSDILGLPRAVRITVVASGHRPNEEPEDAPMVSVRTVVSIDRVPPPRDIFDLIEEELNEQEAAELAEAGGGAAGGAGGIGAAGDPAAPGGAAGGMNGDTAIPGGLGGPGGAGGAGGAGAPPSGGAGGAGGGNNSRGQVPPPSGGGTGGGGGTSGSNGGPDIGSGSGGPN